MIEVKNAIITSASLSIEDHGVLSGWVYLDYGGDSQGFGGYALDSKGANYAGVFIRRVLEVAGVGKWESLKGKTIRVHANSSRVEAIGHIINDDWFAPSEVFQKMESQRRKS